MADGFQEAEPIAPASRGRRLRRAGRTVDLLGRLLADMTDEDRCSRLRDEDKGERHGEEPIPDPQHLLAIVEDEAEAGRADGAGIRRSASPIDLGDQVESEGPGGLWGPIPRGGRHVGRLVIGSEAPALVVGDQGDGLVASGEKDLRIRQGARDRRPIRRLPAKHPLGEDEEG